MKKVLLVLLVLTALLSCLSLSLLKCEKECNRCISCADDISCEGIGCWLKFNKEDQDWLVDKCNFTYYKEHKGGYGNTLQLESCDGGLLLYWAWDSLKSIYVANGWTGETDRGLKIGDTLEQFKMLYPEAKQIIEEDKMWGVTAEIPSTFFLKYCEMEVLLDRNNKISAVMFSIF